MVWAKLWRERSNIDSLHDNTRKLSLFHLQTPIRTRQSMCRHAHNSPIVYTSILPTGAASTLASARPRSPNLQSHPRRPGQATR